LSSLQLKRNGTVTHITPRDVSPRTRGVKEPLRLSKLRLGSGTEGGRYGVNGLPRQLECESLPNDVRCEKRFADGTEICDEET
jgi:hypothetical protein